MPTTNQNNKYGDNVAGNKPISINFPFKSLLLIFFLIFIAYISYINRNSISHYFGWDKVFKTENTCFKILIVPFKVMCKDAPNKDVGLHITERLREINKSDTLNIYPFYYDYKISNNFNADSAEHLQKYHNADQIIYGNYLNDLCSDTVGDEICYNWFTDEKWSLDTLQYNLLTSSNYQNFSIQDLREGRVQGNTDYIIYWIAGLNAYNQNGYSKALKYWLHIYDNLKIRNFSLINNISNLYIKQADSVNANIYCNELLQLAQNPKDSITALINLALLMKGQGDYYKSDSLYRKAIIFSEKEYGKYDPYTLATYSDLAIVLAENENWRESKLILERVVPLLEKNPKKDKYKTMAAKNNLATLYLDSFDYKVAKPLLQEVVDFMETNFEKDHPNNIKTKSNLAIALMNLGELVKAKVLLEESVLLNEKIYGINHPTTAEAYSNLGSLCSLNEDIDCACKNFKKSLSSLKNSLPVKHPNIKIVAQNLKRLNYCY